MLHLLHYMPRRDMRVCILSLAFLDVDLRFCMSIHHIQVVDYLETCSELWFPATTIKLLLLVDPFSANGAIPHLPSDSRGSIT